MLSVADPSSGFYHWHKHGQQWYLIFQQREQLLQSWFGLQSSICGVAVNLHGADVMSIRQDEVGLLSSFCAPRHMQLKIFPFAACKLSSAY